MHASHAARPVRLPWLSWIFLALLLAASMFIRPGTGMKAPSNNPAANYAVAATH
jgi:hypothetical protein